MCVNGMHMPHTVMVRGAMVVEATMATVTVTVTTTVAVAWATG